MFKEVDYDKHFVVGAPLVGWKCDRGEDMSWLELRHATKQMFPNVKFFSAFELDERGLEPFQRVIDALKEVDGEYWTYQIDDMQDSVTSENRWIRIETGRNLIREFAQRHRVMTGHHWGEDASALNEGVINYSAILYADSDMLITPLAIQKLLEVDHPLVSVDVPAYGLRGPVVCDSPRIEEHWNTAGCLLVNSPAYYDLVWSHNNYLNLSDDPTFQSHAVRLLRREGVVTLDSTYGETWVRKDIRADHKGQLVPVEHRKIPNRIKGFFKRK